MATVLSKTDVPFCYGTAVNARTQCQHYHSELDIIAIKFWCCQQFYACIECHREAADHPPTVWPKAERDAAAILCGNCHNTLSINAYFACENVCPHCQAAFNSGCANHYPLYFEL